MAASKIEDRSLPSVVGLTWICSPPTYTYLQNMVLTPYINSERSVLLTFQLVFTIPSAKTRPGAGPRLDVYSTSSLGILTSKLTSYSGVQTARVKMCLPTGRFQVAFLAYTNACSVRSQIQLTELKLTERECSPPTQTSYGERLTTTNGSSKYLINYLLDIQFLSCFVSEQT